MVGFGLSDYEGRIPCPYCGSTDCCGFDGKRLICIKTMKTVTEQQLRESAEKHNIKRREPDNDTCEICEKLLGEDIFHIGDVIGHAECLINAITIFRSRRKICIDDLVEQIHTIEIGQFIEVVPEHECEFYRLFIR